MEEELLGCQVSTIPHERRFIDSVRHQSMAQLFVSGIDKSSCCFAKMAAIYIFLTSVFALYRNLKKFSLLNIFLNLMVGSHPNNILHTNFNPKISVKKPVFGMIQSETGKV